MDVKKEGKKDAIDGILRKCTIALGLVPDCSPQLVKNYTKSGAKSSFCCSVYLAMCESA